MAKRLRDTDPRKRDMRLRFKRLVSAVMLNRQWLDETDEQAQGISMNVKKNVAFLVRQKRKTGILTVAVSNQLFTIDGWIQEYLVKTSLVVYRSVLFTRLLSNVSTIDIIIITNLQEKALLRSPNYYRSVEERKKLCLIVAGLSCFSRIPPVSACLIDTFYDVIYRLFTETSSSIGSGS